MPVRIAPSARKYIEDNGIRALTLKLVELETACCVGVVKEVEVLLFPPNDTRKFWRRNYDGVEIWVDRKINSQGDVVIKKQGFWKFISLYADGVLVPL